ncbi:MAG: hypothetical protein IJT80_08185 [Lachnospiraceae bacterium]|nr:hypothetical protein [Lachnospiraceae bacterium]
MDKNVSFALDDISLIKTVIDRTQKDFSKISFFFIWIGIINGIAAIIEQLMYYFRNEYGYGFGAVHLLGIGYYWFRILGYAFIFFYYLRKIKSSSNDISNGMLKIWGIVLIGSYALLFLYMYLIPSGNDDRINTLWKCRELIEILPVIFALFMTGILAQKRIITVVTAIYSVLFFVLFLSMKQVSFGTIGGSGTLVSVSSITIRVVMIFGMIALGIFLKMGAQNHGHKYNTRSISDEA